MKIFLTQMHLEIMRNTSSADATVRVVVVGRPNTNPCSA
jgi:hypothetical protein